MSAIITHYFWPKVPKPVAKEIKTVAFRLEVRINYPADMPADLITTYSNTVARQIENYARVTAKQEEHSHKD